MSNRHLRRLAPAALTVLCGNVGWSADALDMQGILECLNSLKAGNAVELPVYDFCSHQRSSMTRKVSESRLLLTPG